ncbi:hypothetical protein HRI_001499800 [Hibiscus trionum]|uniref:Uncharacterized protein n=1 Tax=Hibiscus trionum TaxID=183268 RepID=A0A9W7LX74_HIBTR|nr:hypothetical protein HRI_001499800 [Hibiscus trionum]
MGETFQCTKNDNLTVYDWFKRMQVERGDSLVKGHLSELVVQTDIISTQNEMSGFKDIWKHWDSEMRNSFQQEYGDIVLLLDVKVEKGLI